MLARCLTFGLLIAPSFGFTSPFNRHSSFALHLQSSNTDLFGASSAVPSSSTDPVISPDATPDSDDTSGGVLNKARDRLKDKADRLRQEAVEMEVRIKELYYVLI